MSDWHYLSMISVLSYGYSVAYNLYIQIKHEKFRIMYYLCLGKAHIKKYLVVIEPLKMNYDLNKNAQTLMKHNKKNCLLFSAGQNRQTDKFYETNAKYSKILLKKKHYPLLRSSDKNKL